MILTVKSTKIRVSSNTNELIKEIKFYGIISNTCPFLDRCFFFIFLLMNITYFSSFLLEK